MDLGKQIKKHRNALFLSQEELAEKIFVTRQSVSNWENNKTYPDIKSLLMLSELFGVSIDELIKGDVNTMKKEINVQEQEEFKKDSTVFTVLLILMLVLPIPLTKMLGWSGLVICACIFAAAFYYGFRIDRHKKKHDIQTYKEIIAFMDGKSLSEIEQAREQGKRPYQKGIIVAAVMLVALFVTVLICLAYRQR